MIDSACGRNTPTLAYFITSHGFGHAARASAVMKALLERKSDIRLLVFTQAPKWFLAQTLAENFTYVGVQTDVGMVQQSPTRENVAGSIAALKKFEATFNAQRDRLAEYLLHLKCRFVLCDISPLGLAAARIARIPSILIENFTWDWIYDNYQGEVKQCLKPHADFMRAIFGSANYRIQTTPVCRRLSADLCTMPVSRSARTSALNLRSHLAIAADAPMVVITMGGIPAQYSFIDSLTNLSYIRFIVPAAAQTMIIEKNLILLPDNSHYYHPDLINAADAVIGKLGYSTLSEVYHAGVPYGYVRRPAFAESPKLADFVEREMAGIDIDEADFYYGSWIRKIPELLKLDRIQRRPENGADQIADYVMDLLNL